MLVLQSHCDQPDDRQPPPKLDTDDFRHLRFLEVSPRTGLGLEALQGQLLEAVRDMLHRRPPVPIGQGRITVRDQLRTLLEKDQKRRPDRREHRLLSRAEFARLCADTGQVTDPDALLEYLHRCGAVFHRPGLFGDRIILDQTWALEAIYTLFHREHTLPKLRRDGRFTRRDLEHLAWKDYGEEEQQVFLDMMESCGICFRVRNLSADPHRPEWEYLAPELLPEWSDVQEHLFGPLRDEPPDAEAAVSYRFLHEGILRGFLAQLGKQARDAAVYWKYGCWFFEQATRSQVLIRSAWGDDPARPGAGRIILQAWGARPDVVLEHLLETLRAQPIGTPPEVTRSWEAAGPAGEGPRPLLVPSAEYRTRAPAGVEALVVSPRPALPDAGRREVFLSYAWGDDTAEGKRRGELVEQLCARLKE